MEKKKTFGQRAEQFFAGKGFYIVLLLCVAVIGVSAWTLLNDQRDYVDNGDDLTAVGASAMDQGQDAETFTDIQDPAATDTAVQSTQTPETQQPQQSDDPETQSQTAPAEESAETASAPETFTWPVVGEIEVPYSVAALLYNRTMSDWRTHDGLDLAAEQGTQVMAAANGSVESVTNDPLYGCTVVIDHTGGLKSIYANLAETPAVAAGDSVTAGQVIGSVGNTALCETGEVSHLHFAMTLDGQSVDPGAYMPEHS